MTPPRPATPATGISALSGLLVVVFCIAGLLVYEAWSTGRSRREIAERGLQDYAAYATWSTARMADATITASLATLFRGLVGTRIAPTAPLASASALEEGVRYLENCDCALPVPASYYFRVDSRSNDFTPIAPPLSRESAPSGFASAKVGSFAQPEVTVIPSLRERQDLMHVAASSVLSPGVNFAVIFARIGDSSRVVGMAPQRDSAGAVIGTFGFVAVPEVYARTLITHLWQRPQVLPLAITRGLPSDSLLTASVSTPDGKEIYRSSGWLPGLHSDTASLAPSDGAMRVRVALRPDAVTRLGRGLIPSSRVPVWVGLLMLTGLLTAIILRNLQREHELARLRSDFTASVSHELRTPLAQIMLFGETLTLGRTRSDVERVRAAEVIVREARRLMQLVENTLQFSRAERPAVGLSPERVLLAPAIHDIIAGFEPLAETWDVNVAADLDETSSAVVDRSALRQMVLNLLDNALKYGPRGQTISVGVSSPEPKLVRSPAMLAPEQETLLHVVRIWVDDEGPGVFGRSREEIWAPFVRGDTELQATGCGLGLAVVRELAARHSGRAWVESAPGGRGSRFVIELPSTGAGSDRAQANSPPSAVA
ncbi:MAG TPA: HAMP domain-containing sensor histidine kinase [Gemmatimonadaceae bacterium]